MTYVTRPMPKRMVAAVLSPERQRYARRTRAEEETPRVRVPDALAVPAACEAKPLEDAVTAVPP